MTKIELGYGQSSVSFAYDEARFRVLAPESLEEPPLSDVEIGAAFDNPIGSETLEEIVQPGSSVLIVVSDATRATASAQTVNLLVRRLIESGISPSSIRLIFATGIHRAATVEEKRALLTPFIFQRIKTLDHDAYDPAAFLDLGVTRRGTHAETNRALKEHEHVILTGGIGFHYFAGFTGGRKSICPGLASARTIEATHMLALDFERGGRRAGVGTARLKGNAVHEECEEIAGMVAPSFLINAVVDERGRAVRVYAGDWRTAHLQACDEYLKAHSSVIDKPREIVIASCGGSPYDLNMIQAHKALDMAAHACTDGGTIILIAECSDGLGRADFLKWFEQQDSHALEERLRERYEVSGQTAWALLTKGERYRVFLISSLPDEAVRRMRLTPARSIDEAIAQTDQKAEGYILPRGASFLPLVEG